MCCDAIALRISFERCKKRKEVCETLPCLYGMDYGQGCPSTRWCLGNSLNQLETSQLTLRFLRRKSYMLLEEIKDCSFLLLEIILKTVDITLSAPRS